VPRARAGQTVWIERGQTALVLLCLAGVRRRLRVALHKLGRRNPRRFARATGVWAMCAGLGGVRLSVVQVTPSWRSAFWRHPVLCEGGCGGGVRRQVSVLQRVVQRRWLGLSPRRSFRAEDAVMGCSET